VNARRTQPPTDAAAGEAGKPAAPLADDPRRRLLLSGLRCFAAQGYSKTSTRELAEAAGVNVAAISYYFCDKAGLYRAVFFESQGSPTEDIARYTDPALSLEQALQGLYASFLEPLRQGELARQCMKLHAREMVEPTGLWDEEISTSIRPMHDALVGVLCRHFQLPRADDDVHRLAVCIAGLGVHMHVGRDVIDVIAPTLNSRPRSLDTWSERLVMYALAMVQAEGQRRQAAGRTATRTPKP
jgi:TetR/AcrR family transcriptional regulator, regulator of cefoperazone and chloramphenicol sensitivity